jgi:hypothetical protein
MKNLIFSCESNILLQGGNTVCVYVSTSYVFEDASAIDSAAMNCQ